LFAISPQSSLFFPSPQMSGGRSGKMLNYINYRMRVTINDSRMLVGKFLAFDKHMNLVLADCEEFRRISGKGTGSDDREEKRALDLVLVRGENVVSLSVEGPPPIAENRGRAPAAAGGLGRGAPAGRGIPAAAASAAPAGLAGPVAGAPLFSPCGVLHMLCCPAA
jgi:small nuclear ribonucleoprotein B and B'